MAATHPLGENGGMCAVVLIRKGKAPVGFASIFIVASFRCAITPYNGVKAVLRR